MTDFKQALEFGTVLYLRLFSNVSNTSTLRTQVMSGQLSCALIKPKLIVDPFPVVIAANKAVVRQNVSSIITKSIYTELLFNLSLSKNITQCLSKFGVSDDDSEILVAVITNSEDEAKALFEQIKGELCPLENLGTMFDLAEIKKLYNIQDDETKLMNLIGSIVSRIAAKDIL